MNGEKKEKVKDIYILLWSREDIPTDKKKLKTYIESEAHSNVDIQIKDLCDLQQLDVRGCWDFLDHFSRKSILFISPLEEAENMDFWKLGFIMGGVVVHSKEGKESKPRIIEFVKKDQPRFFPDLRDLLPTCKNESQIKTRIKTVMEDMGIEVEIKFEDFTSGNRLAKSDRKEET
jgi:hypothetical protein